MRSSPDGSGRRGTIDEDLLLGRVTDELLLIARGGPTLNVVISVGITIAIINAVIAIILQIARLVFASARDRSWPKPVDDVLQPRASSAAPVAATVLVGLVATVAAAFLPLDWLVYLLNNDGGALPDGRVCGATSATQGRRQAVATECACGLWPAVQLIAVCLYVCYQLITGDVGPIGDRGRHAGRGCPVLHRLSLPASCRSVDSADPIHEDVVACRFRSCSSW